MAFSVIAQTNNSNSAGLGSFTTPALNVAAHDRLFIAVSWASGGGDVVTMHDNGIGNQFTPSGNVTGGVYNLLCYEVKDAIANPNTVISVTDSANVMKGIAVLQVRGLDNSTNAVWIGSNTGVQNTGTDGITTSNLTPSSQPAALIGFCWDAQESGAPVAGTGFTGMGPIWSDKANCALFEYKRLTSTSPVAATFDGAAFQYDAVRSAAWIVPEASGILISTINSGNPVPEFSTAVSVTGTGFANGMTLTISQPGNVSVTQANVNVINTTAATFDLVMEPANANQLAFTDSTYTTSIIATVNAASSPATSLTLTPPTGLIFETLASVNATNAYAITASPALVANDQLEAAGSASNTAAPSGLILDSDATYGFSSGNTPMSFWVRAYDSNTKTWGSYSLQKIGSTVRMYSNGAFQANSFIQAPLPAGIVLRIYGANGDVQCANLVQTGSGRIQIHANGQLLVNNTISG